LKSQTLSLISRQLEYEIGRKPASIPSDGQVDGARFDPVERCEIRVEHDPLAADDVDPSLDPRGDRLGRHSDVIGAPLLA
jgi:hypothetical protein